MTRIGQYYDIGNFVSGSPQVEQAHIKAYISVRLPPLESAAGFGSRPWDELRLTPTFAGLELCMQQQEETWDPQFCPEQRVNRVDDLLKLLEEPSFAGRWV